MVAKQQPSIWGRLAEMFIPEDPVEVVEEPLVDTANLSAQLLAEQSNYATECNRLQKTLEQKEAARVIMVERNAFLEEDRQSLQERLEDLQLQQATQAHLIDDLKRSAVDWSSTISDLQKKGEEKAAEEEKARAAELEITQKTLSAELETTKKTLEATRASEAQLREEFAKLGQDLTEWKGSVQELQADNTTLQHQATEFRELASDTWLKLQSANADVGTSSTLRAEALKLGGENAQLRNDLLAARAKADAKAALKADGEKLKETVTALNTQLRDLRQEQQAGRRQKAEQAVTAGAQCGSDPADAAAQQDLEDLRRAIEEKGRENAALDQQIQSWKTEAIGAAELRAQNAKLRAEQDEILAEARNFANVGSERNVLRTRLDALSHDQLSKEKTKKLETSSWLQKELNAARGIEQRLANEKRHLQDAVSELRKQTTRLTGDLTRVAGRLEQSSDAAEQPATASVDGSDPSDQGGDISGVSTTTGSGVVYSSTSAQRVGGGGSGSSTFSSSASSAAGAAGGGGVAAAPGGGYASTKYVPRPGVQSSPMRGAYPAAMSAPSYVPTTSGVASPALSYRHAHLPGAKPPGTAAVVSSSASWEAPHTARAQFNSNHFRGRMQMRVGSVRVLG